ncbi:MAG: hypothetical protein ACJA0V_004614 [Planctomycetota bacterium]|jgi:hypothetical protein
MVADWHRLFVASLLGVEPASECGLSQPRFWRLSQIAVVAVLPRPLHRFLQHVASWRAPQMRRNVARLSRCSVSSAATFWSCRLRAASVGWALAADAPAADTPAADTFAAEALGAWALAGCWGSKDSTTVPVLTAAKPQKLLSRPKNLWPAYPSPHARPKHCSALTRAKAAAGARARL